jgi:hypothetical protein
MPGKKRKAPDTRSDSRESKIPKSDLSDEERKKIQEMGNKCQNSMERFRQISWTESARTSSLFDKRNFGIGLEPAVKCLGCHRMLPETLITGDHMVPQSDHNALRRKIAYELDKLDKKLYERVVNMRLASCRNDPASEAIRSIKKYDDTLDKDNRNIQPLCWYCNAKKGNRNNVKLFPDNALLPRRPHEAPF